MKDTVKARRLKTMVSVIIVFAGIIATIIIFLNHLGASSVSYVAELYEDDFKVPTKEEYIESLKEISSDIKGMTQYDKYMAGLNVSDGSDSDGDGLTDKEEIEKYGTNPLLVSTSGDFYPDGYKVKNGMDLTKKTDYRGEFDSQMHFPEEFIFSPTIASDYFATVEDNTGSELFSIKGKTTIRKYFIGNYASVLSLDLSKISWDKELSKDTIDVYHVSLSSMKPEKVSFTSQGSVITLDKTYGRDFYYIIIVEKGGGVDSFFEDLTNNVTLDFAFDSDESIPTVLCYGSPLFNNVHIWYDKADDNAKSAAEEMIAFVNDVYKSLSISKAGVMNNIDIYEAKEKAEIDGKISFNGKLLSFSHYDPRTIFDPSNELHSEFMSILNSAYTWFTYEDYLSINNISPEMLGRGYEHVADGFDFSDTFLFPNFSVDSDGKVHGVCAGISHITSKLFNDGALDVTSGTYTDSKGKAFPFDITMDPANKTLMDKGLGDYKSINFVKEHKASDGSLSENLTEGEESFRNLILYYYNETNKRDWNKYGKIMYDNGVFGENPISYYEYNYDLVTQMKVELNAGKILDAGIILYDHKTLKEAFGHAVNIVGYTEYRPKTNDHSYRTGTSEETVFYVYDSNYPHTLGKLITYRIDAKDYLGHHFGLHYYYETPSGKYYTSSGNHYNMFVVFDEDYNVLNDRVKELD